MNADATYLTNAGSRVDNIQFHPNQDLENIHHWLRANELPLHVTKTELVGSRQRLSNLTDSATIAINDVQLSQVTTAKSLGLTIDHKQTDKLTKKLLGIGAIKRTRYFLKQPCI